MDERLLAQPPVDVAGRLLAVPDGHGDGAFAGHHVSPGEHPGVAGHHPFVDSDDAVVDGQIGYFVEQRQIDILAERQHQ